MTKQSKVYVTNLGKYNEGVLVGQWLNVPCTHEEFQQALKNIGVDGVAYEEYFFTDFEYLYNVDEHSNIDEINRIAKISEIINEITLYMPDGDNFKNEIQKELYSFVDDLIYDEKLDDSEIEEKLKNISVFAVGVHDALYHYTMYYLEQLNYLGYNDLDVNIQNVLDIQKIGRDLLLNDMYIISSEQYENGEYKYIIIER